MELNSYKTQLRSAPNYSYGFTLLEILIVTVIIGILAAIAVPAYTEYVQRSKLTEATSGLADYRIRLEQYYQDNRNYGPAGGTCGDANGDGDASDAGEPPLPTSRYFVFSCTVTVGNPQQHVAIASNIVSQGLGAAGSYAFTLDQNNIRRTTAFPGATGLPKACWTMKKGETC